MFVLIAIVVLFVVNGITSTCKTEDPNSPEAIAEREENSLTGAYLASQTFIKNSLKAPSTAKFAKYGYGEDPATVEKLYSGNYKVVIWVDAQNSFGAMLRYKYAVEVKPAGGDMWNLVNIQQLN